MKYEKIANYSETKFRRNTGAKRSAFEKMVKILKEGYASKHQRRGRHQKLSIEDLLLSTLEYPREYRTYAHIAASYDVAESSIYRGIHECPKCAFSIDLVPLPGREAKENIIFFVYKSPTKLRSCMAEGPTGLRRLAAVRCLIRALPGIRLVEDTLIKDGTFSLPGRQAQLKSNMEYEIFLEQFHIKSASKFKDALIK